VFCIPQKHIPGHKSSQGGHSRQLLWKTDILQPLGAAQDYTFNADSLFCPMEICSFKKTANLIGFYSHLEGTK